MPKGRRLGMWVHQLHWWKMIIRGQGRLRLICLQVKLMKRLIIVWKIKLKLKELSRMMSKIKLRSQTIHQTNLNTFSKALNILSVSKSATLQSCFQKLCKSPLFSHIIPHITAISIKQTSVHQMRTL